MFGIYVFIVCEHVRVSDQKTKTTQMRKFKVLDGVHLIVLFYLLVPDHWLVFLFRRNADPTKFGISGLVGA